MLICLSMLAEGRTLPQIAHELAASQDDADEMIEAAVEAVGARNRVHAVNIAIRKGLI